MHYAIRTAREADEYQMAEIEKEAFPTTWPPTPFKRDFSNRSADFLVAYQSTGDTQISQSFLPETPTQGDLISPHGILGFLNRVFRRGTLKSGYNNHKEYIAGYVAIWYMTDEAHITSIAVRGSLRGNGLGELLLMSSIKLAMERQSRVVTLEVRVSNYVAQSLYSKYGFKQVGTRKGYYTDNHEDAYIMTTEPIYSTDYSEQFRSLEEAYKTHHGCIA